METADDAEDEVLKRFGVHAVANNTLPQLSHAFTHFKLHIRPQPLQALKFDPQARETGQIWLSIDDAIGAAVPTPIRKILQSLQHKSLFNMAE